MRLSDSERISQALFSHLRSTIELVLPDAAALSFGLHLCKRLNGWLCNRQCKLTVQAVPPVRFNRDMRWQHNVHTQLTAITRWIFIAEYGGPAYSQHGRHRVMRG